MPWRGIGMAGAVPERLEGSGLATGGAAAPGNAPAGITAGMGVLAGTACVIGLGVLVFGVLNLMLMFRYYGAFKRAALESKRVAASAA